MAYVHQRAPEATMSAQYRQGDVLRIRVRMPAQSRRQLRPVPRTGDRVVLAYGEATGHAHVIDSPRAELLESRGGRTYLGLDKVSALTHEEHGPIRLDPGLYRVFRQREYAPGMRAHVVAD